MYLVADNVLNAPNKTQCKTDCPYGDGNIFLYKYGANEHKQYNGSFAVVISTEDVVLVGTSKGSQ